MADVFEFYGAIKAMKETDKFKPISSVTYQSGWINKTTNFNVVSGDNTRRVENINYLTLEKTINSGYNSSARKCPGCGANISVNTSGKCEYCGSIFNIENYDWVLTSIEM